MKQWHSRLQPGFSASISPFAADLYDQEVPASILLIAWICPISATHGPYDHRQTASRESLNFLKHSGEGQREARSMNRVGL